MLYRLSYRAIAIVVLLLIAACCNTPHAPIGTPSRPDLIGITQEQWERLPPDVQDTVTVNDLALKEYARQLESRINLHDQMLERATY